MFDTKVRDMVLGSLVADAYCLGSHWVYDEEQLRNLKINWEELNNPCAVWHKGKVAGEFTHYGDQLYWLCQFIHNNEPFYINQYMQHWLEKMSIYNGYIDGASKDTMKNMQEGKMVPCGSNSHDFSVISRIVPLLYISSNKEEFLKNAQELVQATHNDATVLEATKFFALLLLEVLNGKSVVIAIESLKEKFSSVIQNWIDEAMASKNESTFEAIRRFGPACGVDGAFSSVIHLLVKYDNFKDVMIANAQAGGDNSARAMVLAPFFVAQFGVNKIPQSWTKLKYSV